MLFIGLVIKIFQNSSKIVCMSKQFGKIEIFVSKYDLFLSNIQEGYFVLFYFSDKKFLKKLALDFSSQFFIIFNFSELFILKKDNQINSYLDLFDIKNYTQINQIQKNSFSFNKKIFIIKIICEMIYRFIINFDDIKFLYQKTNLFFELMESNSKNLFLKIFLSFEFWILFFITDSIELDEKIKFQIQKNLSKIYKKLFLNKELDYQTLRKIFIFFEIYIWKKLLELNNSKLLSFKIKNFLLNERKFLTQVIK